MSVLTGVALSEVLPSRESMREHLPHGKPFVR
ncbi:hypothetical protein EV191_10482 [Tamaricihabitans halophyticus]|uniref:Uncharacterized protein n=1 Tax=Tamaricihabitans halophyticus TaxID=1262583 RepID=A0A4R2R260_9PSEU|nr:hypothetical protein EV191_10482 [Tamaricihabitans halophyticus]